MGLPVLEDVETHLLGSQDVITGSQALIAPSCVCRARACVAAQLSFACRLLLQVGDLSFSGPDVLHLSSHRLHDRSQNRNGVKKKIGQLGQHGYSHDSNTRC